MNNITLSNYASTAPKVDWSKYPSVQEEVYDQNKAGSLDFQYWNEFLEDAEIKAIVQKHIAVLNEGMMKGSAKGKAVVAKATKAKAAKATRTTATKKVAAKRAANKPKVEVSKEQNALPEKWLKDLKKVKKVSLKLTPNQYATFRDTDNNSGIFPIGKMRYLAVLAKNDQIIMLADDLKNNFRGMSYENQMLFYRKLENLFSFNIEQPKPEYVKPATKAKPASKAKTELKAGDYVYFTTASDPNHKKVGKISGFANGLYTVFAKGKDGDFYDYKVGGATFIKTTKSVYDKTTAVSKPKSAPKAKTVAKPKADPKKVLKAEISTLQKKSAITSAAMRKINTISVDTIKQMRGLAGDKETEALKYERNILKAIVAKDTAKLKRIAKSSNIDANILTDILPKSKKK